MRLRAASLAAVAALAASHAAGVPLARADQPLPPRLKIIEDPDGVPVTFTSEDPAMEIFLARGDVPAGTFPDPFERVGLAPVTVKLAPGSYTIETASPKTSTGHERFSVEAGAPMTVDVRGGNASVKAFGGIFLALGVVAALLGIVAIVSISPDDQNYNRWGVGLPLALGGVGIAGLGIGMTALGSTNVVAAKLPPGGASRRTPAPGAFGPTLTLRF
jgi:hypothetical protein